MDVQCAVCGETFTARNRKAKYCSDRCRKRKTPPGEVIDLPSKPTGDEPQPGPVLAQTIRDLVAADRLDTTLGALCLALADRVDHPRMDTGSSFTAVVQKLKETLAEATRGTGVRTAPQQLQDELAAQRAKHA